MVGGWIRTGQKNIPAILDLAEFLSRLNLTHVWHLRAVVNSSPERNWLSDYDTKYELRFMVCAIQG